MNSFQFTSSLLLADAVGYAYLAVALVIIGGGIVGLWYLSRVSPKGTVLAVSVAIYVVGSQITLGTSRELHLLSGSLEMIGMIGGILGIIDLLKKRKPGSARGE